MAASPRFPLLSVAEVLWRRSPGSLLYAAALSVAEVLWRSSPGSLSYAAALSVAEVLWRRPPGSLLYAALPPPHREPLSFERLTDSPFALFAQGP